MTPTEKLLSIASAALSTAPISERVPPELAKLLGKRNGFYAFESALHVLSSDELARWNEPTSWRDTYGDLVPPDVVFFAEDLFGNQFGILRGAVVSFDAETAQREQVGANLGAWIAELMREHRVITGWPLAHEWQAANGPIAPGKRLVPRQPFVLGGEFAVSNLKLADAVTAMRARGGLARQIADLPDGAQIQFTIE